MVQCVKKFLPLKLIYCPIFKRINKKHGQKWKMRVKYAVCLIILKIQYEEN
jgi:hypothetical protein